MKRLLAALLLLATPAIGQEAPKPKVTVPTEFKCMSPAAIVSGVTGIQERGMDIELIVLRGKEVQGYLDFINAGLGTAWRGEGALVVLFQGNATLWLTQGSLVCNVQSLPVELHKKALLQALGQAV
jgi:hypothetical protein